MQIQRDTSHLTDVTRCLREECTPGAVPGKGQLDVKTIAVNSSEPEAIHGETSAAFLVTGIIGCVTRNHHI